MLCHNCNKKISDSEEFCPYCQSVIDFQRCPECWTKLPVSQEFCHKCGCDIEKAREERARRDSYTEPTFKDKIAKLPLWIKAGVPAAFGIIVVLTVGILLYLSSAAKQEAKEISREYIESANDAVDKITEIAELYEENVYGEAWLDHVKSAQELREEHADKISAVKKTREPISYFNDQIESTGNDEIAVLAEEVYYCYTACYGYVIGENGKYPQYLKNYNIHLEKYKEAVEKLENAIE